MYDMPIAAAPLPEHVDATTIEQSYLEGNTETAYKEMDDSTLLTSTYNHWVSLHALKDAYLNVRSRLDMKEWLTDAAGSMEDFYTQPIVDVPVFYKENKDAWDRSMFSLKNHCAEWQKRGVPIGWERTPYCNDMPYLLEWRQLEEHHVSDLFEAYKKIQTQKYKLNTSNPLTIIAAPFVIGLAVGGTDHYLNNAISNVINNVINYVIPPTLVAAQLAVPAQIPFVIAHYPVDRPYAPPAA